jgi:hypothetical protein
LIRNSEQNKAECQPARLVPNTFQDVCSLLEFGTERIRAGCHFGLEIRNVRKGLSLAWRFDREAEREKARKEAVERTRRTIEIAFTVGDIFDGRRKERAAA